MADEEKPQIKIVVFAPPKINLSKDISMAEINKYAPRNVSIIQWWRQRHAAERQAPIIDMPDLRDDV